MRIGNYQFKPRLVPTIATIVLLPILIRLGFWQIARAAQKRQIIAQEHAQRARPPVTINHPLLMNRSMDLAFRRMEIYGSFHTQYQIYIANKFHHDEVGFDVVTPFQIGNSHQYVLVNRGWVPSGKSIKTLPHVTTPRGEVSIMGLARYHPKDVASFGIANRSNQGWPALVRWIDIKSLQKETKLNLLPFLLLLDPQSKYGYVRVWKFINMPPAKHISYAVQWFAMALALVVIYMVVNLKRIDVTETKRD